MTSTPLHLGAGDRIRLRPADRAKVWLLGSGLAEYGEVTIDAVTVTVTLMGRSFTVAAEDDRLVLRDDEGDELRAYTPGRGVKGRLGDLRLDLPGKRPGALKDGRTTLAEIDIHNGVVVFELRAEVAPLTVAFGLAVVLLRTLLADLRTADGLRWTTMPMSHAWSGRYAGAAVAGGFLAGAAGAWGGDGGGDGGGGGGCGGGN